jgi:uncharacterized protein (DUF1800 family)
MMAREESIAAFRFGYGFRRGETPQGAAAMLADVPAVARAARARPSDYPERIELFDRFAVARRRASKDPSRVGERTEAQRDVIRAFSVAGAARIRTAVVAENPLAERLAWFWSNHFTVAPRSILGRAIVPAFEDDAIRPWLAGSFADLLRAAISHPAMLDYLDQSRSIGPTSPAGIARNRGLNENLAREALELHTIGPGADYDQDDVRQFAELLTGLTIGAERQTVFRADMAEPGAETVLGHRYGGKTATRADIDGALADLARHPATARHLSRKLAVHFIADTPDPDVVEHVTAAWMRTGGDLMAVYAALVEHPASGAPLGAKVRQPFEFVVASLRAAGPAVPEALNPARALRRMNQPLWQAPQPNGWPERDVAWISPPGLTARIDWASTLATAIATDVDPREFLDAALGDVARDETRAVVRGAAERWEGIALVLASPEFNRR